MQRGERVKAQAGSPARRRASRWPHGAGGLLACVLAVLMLHAWLLARLGEGLRFGSDAEPAGAAVQVRTLPAPETMAAAPAEPAVADADVAAEAIADASPAPAQPEPRPAPRAPNAQRPASAPASQAMVQVDAANPASAASSPAPMSSTMAPPTTTAGPAVGEQIAAAPAPASAASAAVATAQASGGETAIAEPGAASATAAAASAPATLLAEGEAPPPVYPARLPPAVTLRYEVRRGFLRGTGEIRWRPAGSAYALVLDARIAGLSLLTQTSTGSIDSHGLAPDRFVDQRARRPLQAANFRRDSDRITFSGPSVEWPLLPGSQDRLSWLIQLAGIAAAQPELLVEGGSIAMVVVGARGDAAVWTLRVAGYEDIDTASGSVHAVKLVSRGRGLAGTSAEVWLDPAHGWLPAHATLRNSAGASEYDLLLERIEPGG